MKKFDSTDLKPCSHMQILVSAHVDSMLPGIAEWYTKQHIKGCTQCQASLPFISSLKDRLKVLDDTEMSVALSPERLAEAAEDMEKIDSAKPSA